MKQLDHSLSERVHRLELGAFDYFLVVPGMLFGSYVMPFTIIALGLWLGWKFGAVAVMTAITTLALTNPLKHLIRRDRPAPLEASRAFKLRKLVNNPSFPSGDSAQAGAMVALVILFAVWPWSLFALPLVPLCMFSRVYYGAHWFGDTIAGVAIGCAVALPYGYWFSDFVRSGLPAG